MGETEIRKILFLKSPTEFIVNVALSVFKSMTSSS